MRSGQADILHEHWHPVPGHVAAADPREHDDNESERGRNKQIRDTIIGTTPAGYLGCVAGIRNFDFIARLPSLKLPVLVVCGADDAGRLGKIRKEDECRRT